MTNTSTCPLTVDGVRLDTFAYNIETMSGRRMAPKQRVATQEIPGRNGLVVDFQDAFEEGRCIVKMWIRDSDVNGAGSGRTNYEANLDTLMNLIADARGRLVDLRQTMADGTVRHSDAYLVEAFTPEMFGENAARASLAFSLPNTFWEDLSTADFTFTNALVPSSTNITTMQGATAPIDDGRYLVLGPVTNPRLIDVHSGKYVQLTVTLASGNSWLFDANTRVSRYGAGLTLASADTAGTDGLPITSYTGKFKLFTMKPYLTGGIRIPQLQLTGTSGTAVTAVSVRAKRKFL